jgi:septum site-determining protein MinC
MSIDAPLSTNQKTALEFKSSAFNIPALILTNPKITEIRQQLQKKISQAPDFFKNSPLLIDLHELTKQQADIDIRNLVKTLRSLHFLPVAITGGTDKQNAVAIELGIAIQSVHTLSNLATSSIEEPISAHHTVHSETSEPQVINVIENVSFVENKVITQPVRSGQRIYAKGDLTVLAPVNSSAELMAEGNIHIYAPMRGRALAGVLGNTDSRIFCSDLQAELISIAGIYRLSDDLTENFTHELVQIYLHDQALLIKKL